MIAILSANSLIARPCNEKPRDFASSFSSCGFSLSQRANAVAFRFNRPVQFSVKVSEANLILENKDLEFKPSFHEYLKVLESLNVGEREKTGLQSSRKKNENDKKIEVSTGKIGDDGRRNQGEKLGFQSSRKKSENYKKVEASTGKNGDDTMRSQGEKLGYQSSKKKSEIYQKYEVFTGKNGGDTMRNQGEKLGHQSLWKKSENYKKYEVSVGKNGDYTMTNQGGKLVVDMKKDTWKKMNKHNSVVSKGIIKKEDDLDVERAAFRNLEENNDVFDARRVTKMDMEDRLQKLAKNLNGADINMPEWMFSKMMRSADIRYSDHSILRTIQILGRLGNWRRVLQVIDWMESRERFKSLKPRNIYTTALDVLGKSRRPVEALNLFRTMQKQMSSYPDLVAYRSIAVTLGQAGYLKELFDVIDSMRSLSKKNFKIGLLEKWDPRLEPDIVVYNAVLNACVKREKWEGAFWVLQQLKEQGHEPSSTTYGLVMEVMLACGKYNLVHDFFRKMQKSCIPNALTYRVLLKTFWREGKIEEAIKVVDDMERRGVVGTAGLYYDLARCLCSAGRCREALMQIDRICKVANKPMVVIYTGLIQACLNSGSIKDAALIFEKMQRFCAPNLITYNIMVKAFLDHGLSEEAKELFSRLLENARDLNSRSECREKVVPDIYTFNLMLDACVGDARWDDLEFVYVNMLKFGYQFNSKRHVRIVLASCAVGKVNLLQITWEHLIRNEQIPPPPLIKEMFRLKLEEGDCNAALSCLSCHPKIDLQAFSTKCWSRFFAENSHRFEKDIIIKLVDAVNLVVDDSSSIEQNQIYQNLKLSVKDFLDKQMASVRNSS